MAKIRTNVGQSYDEVLCNELEFEDRSEMKEVTIETTEERNGFQWLSEEDSRKAGIAWNGVDLDSPEEREKTRLMFEEMQAEVDFINNTKISTTLDDGTVLETEFNQLKQIC